MSLQAEVFHTSCKDDQRISPCCKSLYNAAVFKTVNCVFKFQQLMTTHHNIRFFLSLSADFKDLLMIRIIKDFRYE